MHRNTILAVVVLALAVAPPCLAKDHPPAGILAASVGDRVVLVEVVSGLSAEVDTGPVGWLYPAPGGILFAPDVVDGRTAVINLRTQTATDRLDGITMPFFGESTDRYVALAGDALLVSYPDRAVITRIPSEIVHPWQALMAPDDAALLVLERLPDGSTGVHLSLIDLIARREVSRIVLAGDIVHMALSAELGVLALADAGAGRVHLATPATAAAIADRPVAGRPVDVAFVGDGRILATAVATADGGGELDLAVFKSGKKGLRLAKEHELPLPAAPVRVAASPDGRFLAAALTGGSLVVVDVEQRAIVATHRLAAAPRDLRWCDPTRPGPVLPEWTDGEGEAPDFGPFAPPVRKKKNPSGLVPP